MKIYECKECGELATKEETVREHIAYYHNNPKGQRFDDHIVPHDVAESGDENCHDALEYRNLIRQRNKDMGRKLEEYISKHGIDRLSFPEDAVIADAERLRAENEELRNRESNAAKAVISENNRLRTKNEELISERDAALSDAAREYATSTRLRVENEGLWTDREGLRRDLRESKRAFSISYGESKRKNNRLRSLLREWQDIFENAMGAFPDLRARTCKELGE